MSRPSPKKNSLKKLENKDLGGPPFVAQNGTPIKKEGGVFIKSLKMGPHPNNGPNFPPLLPQTLPHIKILRKYPLICEKSVFLEPTLRGVTPPF